jgi:Xaa-Pro aminopeptidase
MIGPDRLGQRLSRARRATADAGAAALLVGVGSDLRYLTGYAGSPSERLTLLVLPPEGEAVIVAPRLEAMAAAACPAVVAGLATVLPWDETDDPHGLALERCPGRRSGELLVSDRLWSMHVLALQASAPGARFGLATPALRRLRMVKDPDEIALLRLAAQAADRVIEAIATGSLIGRTEADVAAEVRLRLVAEGHDEASFAIVASGPNSASPHHDASDRVIRAGDPLVLDIGGSLGGYGSDITRTIWVGGGDPSSGPDPEFVRIFDLVREAQARATAAVRPGIRCEQLDAVARGIIERGGFGARFLHRLGHGIGLEVHEDPYLVAGNPEPLEPGYAFSIEPGIYLEGRFGVRIEDIVVCGVDGPIVLNEATRDLRIVAG